MAADQMLTIATVAGRLNTSKKTVYRRIHAGEIKPTDIAPKGSAKTRLRVRESALAAYLANRDI